MTIFRCTADACRNIRLFLMSVWGNLLYGRVYVLFTVILQWVLPFKLSIFYYY